MSSAGPKQMLRQFIFLVPTVEAIDELIKCMIVAAMRADKPLWPAMAGNLHKTGFMGGELLCPVKITHSRPLHGVSLH